MRDVRSLGGERRPVAGLEFSAGGGGGGLMLRGEDAERGGNPLRSQGAG